MRINIETKGKRVTDKDIRALYIILNGLNTGSDRMKKAHLEFFADKLGYKLIPKDEQPKQIGTNCELYADQITGTVFTVKEAMYDYGDIQDGNGNSLLSIPLLKYTGQKIKIIIEKL